MGNELHRVLRTRTIVTWGVGLILIAGGAATVLLLTLGGGTPGEAARLEALRTAANIVVGTGGAAALLLTARRQRSAELDLVQKDHDATQRRMVEMYSKAADQLGSDKAPVRLSGLYLLERLAQDHQPLRQTVVNVVCAYLRMPFEVDGSADSKQELEVRKAAQRILMLHLRFSANSDNGAFWPGIDLDFTGATLVGFDYRYCRIRSAVFAGVSFLGTTDFRYTTIATKADFTGAAFAVPPIFDGAEFPPGALPLA
jgi:hypothetical protein